MQKPFKNLFQVQKTWKEVWSRSLAKELNTNCPKTSSTFPAHEGTCFTKFAQSNLVGGESPRLLDSLPVPPCPFGKAMQQSQGAASQGCSFTAPSLLGLLEDSASGSVKTTMLTSTCVGPAREKRGFSICVSERGRKSKAGGSGSGRALLGSSSHHLPLTLQSLGLVSLVTMAPHQPWEEPLQQKRTQSPAATSAGSPRLAWRRQVRNQTLPGAAKGTPRGPRPVGYRHQLPTWEQLHCASSARSPKRKWSTSAGRKGSKGLKHTLFPPLFTGSSTRCVLASAAGSCLPQSVQWERSKHCLLSRSHLSYSSTPSCLRWDSAPLLPWGCWPRKQAHSPQMMVARCLWLSSLGHPCASVPWGLRTPGFCPCAPCPGHHPGSAGPEEESTRQG